MSTVLRNSQAGNLIRELRSDRGLSPEALSFEILKGGHGSVSARTIRRVEQVGEVPRVRVQFALASYFDRSVSSIWTSAGTRKVEKALKAAA